MPHLTTNDGVRLYYEEAGSGYPIVFVHEFAGDYRSYETQLRFLPALPLHRVQRARLPAVGCARGLAAIFAGTGVRRHPRRARRAQHRQGAYRWHLDGRVRRLAFRLRLSRSRQFAGGRRLRLWRQPDKQQQFLEESTRTAAQIESRGMEEVSKTYGAGPTRVQLQNKDPRGYAEFVQQLSEHSTRGSANTQRGVQGRRPSLWDLTEEMKKLEVPTLVATGDEDDPCLEPGILMKRMIPTAALVVLPNTGHALNLEEPDLFNQACADFFHQVESGRWPRRDPRAVTGSILGM